MNDYRNYSHESEWDNMGITGDGLAKVIHYPFLRLSPTIFCSLKKLEQHHGTITHQKRTSCDDINENSQHSGKRIRIGNRNEAVSTKDTWDDLCKYDTDPLTSVWSPYTIDIFYGSPSQGFNVVVAAFITSTIDKGPWLDNEDLLSSAQRTHPEDSDLIESLQCHDYRCVVGLTGRDLRCMCKSVPMTLY